VRNVARVRQGVVEVPRELWDGVLETVDALADEAEMESIRKGIADIRSGRVISKAEFLRRHPHLPR